MSRSAFILLFFYICCFPGCSTWGKNDESGQGKTISGSGKKQTLIIKDSEGVPRWRATLRAHKFEMLNPRVGFPGISPDFRHFAFGRWSYEKKEAIRTVIDGKEGKEYDSIGECGFSPDSKRFFYAAEENEEYFIVLDGKEGPRYEEEILYIVFSPDSKRIAYRAERDDKEFVVLDGKEFMSHEFQMEDIFFSPDSRHFVHCGRDNQATTLYLDGRKVASASELKYCTLTLFSPDSQKLFYKYKKDRKWFAVFGKEEFGPFDEVEHILAQISPDSKRIAFPAKRGDDWFMVTSSKEYGLYENWCGGPLFSPDSKRLVFSACVKGRKVAVLLDGKQGDVFDSIQHKTFSPDGRHFAMSAKRDGKYHLIVDGVKKYEYDFIGDVLYSPDSKRLATTARKGDKSFVVVDGREGKSYDNIRRAYFSPDSKHLAYWAGVEAEKETILVIDGHETLRFKGSTWPVHFTDDNRIRSAAFHYIGQDSPKPIEQHSQESFRKEIQNVRVVLFEMREIDEKK
ncbi:MAG: hypothetical protein E3J72_11805 [Planctomycetota bacterium]|nr:MAG: hypothetical protein E3J72_11805 [Planctomycetota bacterium]